MRKSQDANNNHHNYTTLKVIYRTKNECFKNNTKGEKLRREIPKLPEIRICRNDEENLGFFSSH